ncbi:MAG: hypothetical protein K2X47_06015, partial [Bdellovibrionales bacterium]|nr:hypothetical protein [Bdellovibrionales bacterium]
TQGSFIPGIEPTLPADGRLLLFHIGNRIHYTYNANPLNLEGWSGVKSLHLLYSDRNVDLAGVTLGERYPLASRPLKDGFGQTIEYTYSGAYPWISLDGTELFHTAVTATDGATRSGVSVIGRWTNWTLRHIDGPINPTLVGSPANNTLRLFYSSPGQTPGMWPIYPKSGAPIPLTRNTPVYPLFGSNTSDYNEVSFEDFVDGNYRLFFRMNELLTSGYPNTLRTPDTSGSFNTGELEGGAVFPFGVQNRPDGTNTSNENVGAYGRAIYFPASGVVRVRNTNAQGPGLANLGNNLSFQFWVKRLVDLPNATRLFHREDTISIGVDANQKIFARLWTTRGQLNFIGKGPALNPGKWHHVACVVTATTFKIFVDGKIVFSETGTFELAQSHFDLLIGPGSTPSQQPSTTPILVMDEVTLSVVERSEEEIARAAHVDPVLIEQSPGAIQAQLPLGLDYRDLRLPSDNVSSRAVVEIGRRLFNDVRFSSNRQVSCATCHDAGRDFTDGLPKGKGVSGRILDRNTPNVLNRAFSTRQMLDGRAASLESQAVLPLSHPDEMGFTLAQALSEVNADSSYKSQFRSAFGVDTVEADQFTRAIAGFQRAQMTGNSKVDQYEAGQLGALSLSQIRGRNLFHGKARCVACHSGSNYSDESFHNIGLGDTDPGRERVTGRAQDRGSFKTPSLRNLVRTAPYFHNGHALTLAAVVEHYVSGGNALIVNGQDVRDTEMRKLDLSTGEQEDLVSFLTALNGEVTEIYLGTDPSNQNPVPVTTTTTQPTLGDLRLLSGSAPTTVYQGEEFEVRCNYTRPAGCAYAMLDGNQGCRYIRGESNAQIF